MEQTARAAHPVEAMPLSIAAVSSYLETTVLGSTLAVVRSIDSTNSYIKTHISALDDGFVIIADKQLSGRGRLGKSFVSPNGGVYMSVLLMGREHIKNAEQITVRAAVAVRNAIAQISGIENVGIKWVNDIYINEKKVCGILAERVIRKGFCDFCVLGIGINLFTSKESLGELSETAGAISHFTQVHFSKNELVACVLNHLEKTLFVTDKHQIGIISDQYRDHSVIIGKEVNVISGDITKRAKVLGIDDDASLYVQYDDGKTEILRSGEVSTALIRKEDGQ